MAKTKHPSEERLQAVKDYLTGQRSAAQICSDMEIVSQQTLYDWVGNSEGMERSALSRSKEIKDILPH